LLGGSSLWLARLWRRRSAFCRRGRIRGRCCRPLSRARIRYGLRPCFRQRRVEVLELMVALHPFAVDEEARRRIDLELFVRLLAHGDDFVEQVLVGDALIELLFREPGLARDEQKLVLAL